MQMEAEYTYIIIEYIINVALNDYIKAATLRILVFAQASSDLHQRAPHRDLPPPATRAHSGGIRPKLIGDKADCWFMIGCVELLKQKQPTRRSGRGGCVCSWVASMSVRCSGWWLRRRQ